MIEPTGKMAEVMEAIWLEGGCYRDALIEHLRGGTSAGWIADTLTEAGYPIGATTIKSYRRKLREANNNEGSVKL